MFKRLGFECFWIIKATLKQRDWFLSGDAALGIAFALNSLGSKNGDPKYSGRSPKRQGENCLSCEEEEAPEHCRKQQRQVAPAMCI